jgi:hypothetical protein
MKALLVPLMALLVANPAMAIEEPRYAVVRSTPDFELRQYEPYAVVETLTDGELETARNTGFDRLFKYISGSNRAQQKIEMTIPVVVKPAAEKSERTAPVIAGAAGGAGVLMQFVLPSRFDARTAPQPTDPEIRIRDVTAQSIAVRRFSGRPNDTNYRENEAKLLTALQEAGLVATDVPRFAFYNPPFTPWFMRRNEVLVPVERARSSASPAGS